MEVSLSKTGFSCYNKIFTQEVKKEATQDTVVPDTMPDISEIIDASGIFMIRSKEVGDGKVKITGNVAVRVIYKAEEEKGVCSIETSVPAELYEESNNIGDDAACSARVLVMLVEARALNPRKVLVRAADAHGSGYRYRDVRLMPPSGFPPRVPVWVPCGFRS